MKSNNFIVLIIVVTAVLSCTTPKEAQIVDDSSIVESSNTRSEYLTSKTPYPFKYTSYTPVPDGYTPVFINYVGRHGSRHLSSPKYDITLKELLDIAYTSDELTEIGKELRSEIKELIIVENGNYGELSALGKLELQHIGTRMFQNYSSLFQNRTQILTKATYKNRAQDSRDNFIIGLTKQFNDIESINTDFDKGLDPYLRPYDISPMFMIHEDGEGWKDLYKSYEKKDIGVKYSRDILLKLFSEDFYIRLDSGEFELLDYKGRVKLDSPKDATKNLYNLYIISSNLKAESSLNFRKYFTVDQLTWFESVLAIEDYYEKGPSISTTDLPTNIIAPLVKDMINAVEEHKDNTAGVFRFAHAETIIPLASFLEINGANISSNNPEEVMALWDIKTITPMGANIQWIIYSNGSKKLIKMLYNELEIKFPEVIKPVNSIYYNWSDVKSYYTNKIEDLGFKMSNSLIEDIEYLKGNY